MLVISDTSPISNLLLVKQLELLHALFGEVVVPPAVDVEVRRLKELGEDTAAYEYSTWIKVQSPASSSWVEHFLLSLDEGESEAIALAKEIHCDLLLIDERRGTRIAKSQGLQTIGLLGVLSKAKEKGLIKSVRPLLEDLEAVAGFWLGAKLKVEFLSDHGE